MVKSLTLFVRNIRGTDFSEVCKIWRQELPNDFASILGEKFINDFYLSACLPSGGVHGWVFEVDGKVLGFLLAGDANTFLRERLRSHWTSLLLSSLKTVLLCPWRIRYFLEVFWVMLNSPDLPSIRTLELLYIAVSAHSHNGGVGSTLISQFLEEAKVSGYEKTIVKTLSITSTSNSFYLKNGFKIFANACGRNWYVHEVE